jgi:hypothetical protein
MGTTPTGRHWPSLTHCRHLRAGLLARPAPIIRIARASSLFGQSCASLFRHDMAEARVMLPEPSVVGILGPRIRPFAQFRPSRALLGVVTPTVERIVFSESTHAFPTGRSNPGSFPHFYRPHDPHRTQTPLRQIEQRVPLVPEQLDPVDLCPPEVFEAVCQIKFVSNDVIAIIRSEPIVKWSLSARPSNFEMLLEADFNRFGRETDIPIAELRSKPDPIDQASGR